MVAWLYVAAVSVGGGAFLLTYTQLGLLILWVEHLSVAIFFNLSVFCVGGARLLLRSPVEFGVL